MNSYITGSIIKELRLKKNMSQQDLASKLFVSDKTISKWETGKGYPDISLLEDLAKCLNVSLFELISGQSITNTNKSANMLKTKFYVCPICGNIITSVGESVISCCGLNLTCLEAEENDGKHQIKYEKIADEYYITIDHSMNKNHYLSFIAIKRNNGMELIKLYPEAEASATVKIAGIKYIYCYCNHHGLFVSKV